MRKSKKTQEVKLSEFNSELNFAFCPDMALVGSMKLFERNKDIKSFVENFPYQDINNLRESYRYFYICYSLKVHGLSPENKDYFYFQLYSQIGNSQNSEEPMYGFFEKEKIVSIIEEINEMFDPPTHHKKILDTYVDEFSLNADLILSDIQKWTDEKLSEFSNSYFRDQSVVNSLYNIVKADEENQNFQKNIKKNTRKRVRKI